MPFFLPYTSLTLLLSLLVDFARSAPPPRISRPGFTPTVVRKDESDTVQLSKREPLSNPETIGLIVIGGCAAFILIFCIFLICTGGFRRAGRCVRKRIPLHQDDQGGGVSTFGSDMWSLRPKQDERLPEPRSQTSSTTVTSTPTIMTTVVGSCPGETLPRRASAETSTSLPLISEPPISTTLCTDATRTTAASPALNPPHSFSQSTPSSSLTAINRSARSSQVDKTPKMIPEMTTLGASHRLEPVRALPTPSPTPSFDTWNDRSPSLAEFPSPPQLSFRPLPEISTSPWYVSEDLGDLRNIRSPVSPQFEPQLDSVVGVGSISPYSDRRGSGPPLSAGRSRPPTYYSAWHRSTPSMSTISTLPAYTPVERDDNNVVQVSQPRSNSRSSRKQRSMRATVVRPPLPTPPFALSSPP